MVHLIQGYKTGLYSSGDFGCNINMDRNNVFSSYKQKVELGWVVNTVFSVVRWLRGEWRKRISWDFSFN